MSSPGPRSDPWCDQMVSSFRNYEIVCGVVASVFVIEGLRRCLAVSLDQGMISFMRGVSRGLFLLFFNFAAAVGAFKPATPFVSQFGYLLTWTGRAFHFVFFGVIVYGSVCEGNPFECLNDILDDIDEDELYEFMLIVSSIASVLLGMFLLVARSSILPGTTINGVSRPVQHTLLSTCATISSIGMVVFGLVLVRTLLFVKWKASYLINAALVVVAGVTSLVSSTQISPTVLVLFGFLYHSLGRGLFYLIAGFYMFPQIPKKADSYTLTICAACSVLSMAVGAAYLIDRLGMNSGGAALQPAQVTVPRPTAHMGQPAAQMWQQPVVQMQIRQVQQPPPVSTWQQTTYQTRPAF